MLSSERPPKMGLPSNSCSEPIKVTHAGNRIGNGTDEGWRAEDWASDIIHAEGVRGAFSSSAPQARGGPTEFCWSNLLGRRARSYGADIGSSRGVQAG